MKIFVVFLSTALLSQAIVIEEHKTKPLEKLNGANGGIKCAVCSVLLTLIDGLAVVYNDTIEESLTKFCNYLPDGIFRITCEKAVKTFGPVVIDG